MRILRKLLDNLGDVWNKLPKEMPFLTIGKGTGNHTMMTVDEGVLYFHSAPFRSGLPLKQSITLKSMTTQELLDIIATMGYTAGLTSEAQDAGLDRHKPFILMEVQNVPMGKTLTAFTSNLWRTMYPLYRVLRQAEFDTEQALKQLHRQLADGEWLDFWASFFSIEREPGETDNKFVRRFTMWLFNPKTNNIALKELLAYRLEDTDFDVLDKAPLEFEVFLGTKYLETSSASELHKILREAKGAGIEFFLNYFAPTHTEDWKLAAADFAGKPFNQLDEGMHTLQKAMEDSFKKPADSLNGSNLAIKLADAFLPPSEGHSSSLTRALAETTFVKPLDALSRAFQMILTDTYPTPSEDHTSSLRAPYADAYALPQSESAFELGVSILNNPVAGVDALFDSNAVAQDVCVATLTVKGQVIKQVFV